MFWTGRAITEYQQAARTLFGTFTMSPDEHYLLDARAQVGRWGHPKTGRPKSMFSVLSPEDIFTARARQFGEELQRYMKRIRKGDAEHPSPHVRYLLIAEMHDSEKTSPEMKGRPHFHILLHEQQAGALVLGDPLAALEQGADGEYERRRVKTRKGWQWMAFVKDDAFIRKNWLRYDEGKEPQPLGFTNFQWAHSTTSAVYVCKYLTKALAVRVRASQYYGLREDEARNPLTPTGQAGLVRPSVTMTPPQADTPSPKGDGVTATVPPGSD